MKICYKGPVGRNKHPCLRTLLTRLRALKQKTDFISDKHGFHLNNVESKNNSVSFTFYDDVNKVADELFGCFGQDIKEI